MTNYLLSIDPSIKNTGFTLWEKEFGNYCDDDRCHNSEMCKCNDKDDCCYEEKWKPIWIYSYSFKKYGVLNFESEIFFNKIKNNNIDLIIERGTFHSKNGIGYETQEHLRGFIAGQFNKLLTKDMLISPRKWQYWYLNNYCNVILLITIPYKWSKDYSILIANYLIKKYNWNITISNHDEADSLLIGWYYLNKEEK